MASVLLTRKRDRGKEKREEGEVYVGMLARVMPDFALTAQENQYEHWRLGER
jgi:hypothetical protein